MNQFDLPDFPLWGWILAMAAFSAAIIIPFYMLIRIKGFRHLRAKAAAHSKGMLAVFWILLVGTYLFITSVIVMGYLNAWF